MTPSTADDLLPSARTPPRPPSCVPGAGHASADELEPRPRTVSAAGPRPSAPRFEWIGPAHPRPEVALLGGRMQGPVRVIEVRPPDRAQVGPPGEQDRVHVVPGRDRS